MVDDGQSRFGRQSPPLPLSTASLTLTKTLKDWPSFKGLINSEGGWLEEPVGADQWSMVHVDSLRCGLPHCLVIGSLCLPLMKQLCRAIHLFGSVDLEGRFSGQRALPLVVDVRPFSGQRS